MRQRQYDALSCCRAGLWCIKGSHYNKNLFPDYFAAIIRQRWHLRFLVDSCFPGLGLLFMVHWTAEKVSTLLRGSGLLSNFLFIKCVLKDKAIMIQLMNHGLISKPCFYILQYTSNCFLIFFTLRVVSNSVHDEKTVN